MGPIGTRTGGTTRTRLWARRKWYGRGWSSTCGECYDIWSGKAEIDRVLGRRKCLTPWSELTFNFLFLGYTRKWRDCAELGQVQRVRSRHYIFTLAGPS